MEIRVLKYFLAVAREENISAAAESLHVTQPTLSRQLMDLEDELGKTLFTRGNRRIVLTEEGMILRKRAEEIISLVDKTESEIMKSDDNISGDVYIGGGETEGIRLIAQTAKQLNDEGYNIRYHIFSGNAVDVSEKIDKGLLDFGIFLEASNLQKYNSIQLPYTDTWGVLMRKDSPLAQKKEICPDDLWDVPLITSQQADTNNELSNWIKRDKSQLNIAATYNLLYNASLMVEEGIGYALCIDRLVRITDDGPLCFRPLKPKRTARLDIVWKRYQVFSKAAEMFLKKLQENFSK
ncbi:LysR family transcriptional regulator [Ructibacterium gallinarum]|uniref:LysR family transcriptional regulator n=1 Tax=Ructibacterium gallinarum TaxID=2779355 RepID=A0A9D5RB07_9FIRM|nr:LysR family transcriptional regulator [Ructibacterium gallinarum]MBE5039583.1 LysR family transcriptional regulator [Ructibacterium gallinarum]